MKNNIIKNAFINAFATAAYVAIIASSLFYAPKVFKSDSADNIVLIPIIMLLLLIFSASVTGLLVFGCPIVWYLDGKKKEAITLLAYTLGILISIIVIFLFTLYFISI